VKRHHPDSGNAADPMTIRQVNAAYRLLLDYVTEYRFSFAEEEFYEQNPEERLRQQFMETPLWGRANDARAKKPRQWRLPGRQEETMHGDEDHLPWREKSHCRIQWPVNYHGPAAGRRRRGLGTDPFDYFLASIGTCAGIYVLSFCQERQIATEGLALTQRLEFSTTADGKERLPKLL